MPVSRGICGSLDPHWETGLSINPMIVCVPKTTPESANTTQIDLPMRDTSESCKSFFFFFLPTPKKCNRQQVAPSFFDAPGAQDTSSATAGAGSAGLLPPAPPSMVSLASVQRLSDELPNITFAFASEVGYKVKSSLMHCSYPCTCMHRAHMSSGILEQDHINPASVAVMSICVT